MERKLYVPEHNLWQMHDGRAYMSYFKGNGKDSNCRNDCDGMMQWWVDDLDGSLPIPRITGGHGYGTMLPDVPGLVDITRCQKQSQKAYACSGSTGRVRTKTAAGG